MGVQCLVGSDVSQRPRDLEAVRSSQDGFGQAQIRGALWTRRNTKLLGKYWEEAGNEKC